MKSAADLRESVAALMRSTRSMLMPHWGNVIYGTKGGSAADVLTELDTNVEQYLKDELAKLDSSIAFAGEEFGGSREHERFWLCDPIDGTAHFIRGLPFCTVMLALIEHQQVVLSFVYIFSSDELYEAEAGKGAYCNGKRIKVSDRVPGDAYVSWEMRLEKQENIERFKQLRSVILPFKTVSAGWEFAMIAAGRLEGRVQFDPYGKDYDFAPGSLLVAEAGGVVANIGKRTYDYRDGNFIAANKPVFAALTEGQDAVFPL